MDARSYGNLVALLLVRHREKHLGVLALATLLVFLGASTLMLADSLRTSVAVSLEEQPDMIVQRIRAGRAVEIPVAWADELAALPGVASAQPRVFGRYFHEQNGTYFTLVGVDLFAEADSRRLERLVAGLDLRAFLDGDRMLVGDRVARFLEQNRYGDRYVFRTPRGEPVPVQVHGRLPDDLDLVAGDLVLVEIGLARRILGLGAGEATDLALRVPNALEGDLVMDKVIGRHFDVRVIQRKELAAAWEDLFQLRSGLILLLGGVVLAAFALVLYQRYSLITGSDRQAIGLLRATGWSVRQVIALKMGENLLVGAAAWAVGVVVAYGYVFGLGAPGLTRLFVGLENLAPQPHYLPALDPALLGLLLLFFLLPYGAAVLVPVWRLASLDPTEAMK